MLVRKFIERTMSTRNWSNLANVVQTFTSSRFTTTLNAFVVIYR